MVSGVLSILMSFLGLFYAAMGAMFAAAPAQANSDGPPSAMFAMLFGVIGIGLFVFMLLLAFAKFRTARLLKQRRSKTFCMVVAGITCLGIPWGTMLGVATFMVLGRDSVARQFDAPGALV